MHQITKLKQVAAVCAVVGLMTLTIPGDPARAETSFTRDGIPTTTAVSMAGSSAQGSTTGSIGNTAAQVTAANSGTGVQAATVSGNTQSAGSGTQMVTAGTTVDSAGAGTKTKSTISSSYYVVGQGKNVKQNVDSSIGLGGATITMLKGTESGQQLAIVIQTSDGHLIVVDGGIKTNAPYLGNFIKSHGGKVDAWLLTHPHVDHAGALAVILEHQMNPSVYQSYADFQIDNLYYSFAPMDFYQSHEDGYRIPFIQEITADLAQYTSTQVKAVHADSPAGTSFNVGNVNIRILNQAMQINTDSGNNSSVTYMITINGKKLLILGDLPYEASQVLLQKYGSELKADIVQMAHHGQHGASQAFYQTVHPEYALWPTHQALWTAVTDSYDPNQSVYTIALTKYWMDQIGVKKNFVMADGDWILK